VERRQLERSQPPAEGLTLFFVIALSVSAAAQTAEPKVTGTLSNVTRVESWSYFQPFVDPRVLPPPGSQPLGSPDYTFIGDRAELGVRVAGSRFDLGGAFNYVRLENLPRRAIGPGGLGTGAFYYAATGVPYSYQLYVGELTLKVKSRDRRAAVTIGRMPFTSGGESVSTNESLERLKRERLHSRLIGNFEWSYYQRRFDGARFDLDRSRWHVNAAAFVPTQGGFEESTNLSMPRVQLASASLTHKAAHAEYQAFSYFYRDRRPLTAVVDNSGSRDRPVNVTIATVGGSYARVSPTPAGELDAVAWGAAQTGDWYGRNHRAASVAIEAGHRWTSTALTPWLRGGYLWASGDSARFDDRHGTFFQMLPSSRQYALSSVYAQMNLRDLFAQLQIEPRRFRARIEVHALHLADAADLWYQGSGATASKDRFFGFSGRSSGGHAALGSVVEGTIDVPIKKYWSISGYAAMMSPGDAVRGMFTNKKLTFWSVENVIRF
jgi:hypothetical protein